MVENAKAHGAPGSISSFADGCAREAIHIPGSIQPHGFLLVVDGTSHAVIAASANAGMHLRMPGGVIGAKLADILPQAQPVLALDANEPPDGPATYGRVDLDDDEGRTVLTLYVERTAEGYTLHVENLTDSLRIEVDHDEAVEVVRN